MSQVQHVTVADDDDGQRLDRWFKKHVPDIPYVLVQKFIRKGQVRVDGKRIKPDFRLTAGQDIRLPPMEENGEKKRAKNLSAKEIAFIKSLVIHDDGDIVAINKPAGLSVQGGSKIKFHIDGLLGGLKNKDGIKPRLVHRLDKDTSGVLLLARSAKVARELGRRFQSRHIKKIYWALVAPVPETHDGTIKAKLIKSGGANKERMVRDENEGKPAVTEYRVIDRASDQVAFVAFWPRTGRTHQIRVHAELAGFPIVGDPKYSGHNNEAEGQGTIKLTDRLHLHAHRVILEHPTRKGMLDISAPLADDLKKSWRSYGFDTKMKADPFEDLKV